MFSSGADPEGSKGEDDLFSFHHHHRVLLPLYTGATSSMSWRVVNPG
jgi:hypothetical protein